MAAVSDGAFRVMSSGCSPRPQRRRRPCGESVLEGGGVTRSFQPSSAACQRHARTRGRLTGAGCGHRSHRGVCGTLQVSVSDRRLFYGCALMIRVQPEPGPRGAFAVSGQSDGGGAGYGDEAAGGWSGYGSYWSGSSYDGGSGPGLEP